MNAVELYYWPTPNGQKITIFLEETAVPYTLHPVDIGKGDQFSPEFLRISPNNKMPALVDPAGPDGKPIAQFESGAILLYLAEKTGRFLPRDPFNRYQVIQWLMFQMSGVGPMLGQAHHFRGYAPEKIEYAINRYTKEAGRLYSVMDTQLAVRDYIAGEYSIGTWPSIPGSCHMSVRARLWKIIRASSAGLGASLSVRRCSAVWHSSRNCALRR